MKSHDIARFTAGTFLRDKMAIVAIALLVIAFITFLLVILGVTIDAIVLIDSALAACVVLALVLEYRRRASFWKDVETAIEALDRTRYIGDLVDEPGFSEGRLALDAMLALTQLNKDELGELRTQNHERAQYTELWVHEVKTPLAAAKLVLDRMHGPDVAKLKIELERIEGLVEQALFTARSDTLVNDYLIREVRIADAVGEACKSNMCFLASCGVALNMQVDPQVTVMADRTWLAFILNQLITNAAKYDASTITFTTYEEGNEGPHACTVLELRDDGCGIPAADVPRVFDRGFTGEVGRAHGSATGMGLFLVARMCAQMGLDVLLGRARRASARACKSSSPMTAAACTCHCDESRAVIWLTAHSSGEAPIAGAAKT